MVVCIYHRDDLDGHCSAAVLLHTYPDAVLIPYSYEDTPAQVLSRLTSDVSVYMIDVSMPLHYMQQIQEQSKEFIWLDHHRTAIEEMHKHNLRLRGIQRVGQAGCELAWDFLNPDKPAPLAVRLLGRWDVWDHQDPRVIPFQFGMRAHFTDPCDPEARQLWQELLTDESKVEDIIAKGTVVFAFYRRETQAYYKKFAYHGTFEGHPAVFLNHGKAGSMAFYHDPYFLSVSYARLPDGRWQVNLYSNNAQIDCGTLASRYGGGGHRGAGGFICEVLPF